jgi:hypothetical protein
VLTPEITTGLQVIRRDAGQCLVVWGDRDRQPLPLRLHRFLTTTLHAQLAGNQVPHYAEARLKRSHQQVFRVGFLLFPDGLGECR